MAKVVLPRVHVMLLCDEIVPVADEEGVYNLLGARTHIVAPAFPYVHPQLIVYLQVTGHEGTVSGVMEVVHARTDESLFQQLTPTIPLHGPLEVVPVWVVMEDCEFPEAGIYYCQIYFDGKLLCERLLNLIEGQASNGRQQA